MYPHTSLFKNSPKSISLLILLALGLAAIFAPHSTGVSIQWPSTSHSEDLDSKREAFGRLPLSFELNQGQTDARVKFLSRGQGYGIFLTDDGATFSFTEPETALHMRLQGTATSPRFAGVDQLPGKANYLLGNKSNEWRTNIPTYERVRYQQVYPGVDLVYYGNQRQLEFDFVIEPHASFKQIRIAFAGAGKLKLNRQGDLILQSGARKLTLLRPKGYQTIDNKKREVPVNYSLKRGEVSFKVGKYDKTHPLVIDPLLVYSTFLGGSGQDAGNSIAVDASGSVYIAGQTASLNFPTSAPLQATNGAAFDAFVAKLNASGSALVYSTYLGGNSTDVARSIAIDAAGNAYITGETSSSNFPVLNSLHPTFSDRAGTTDAFVAELNSSGSALVYSTYLGGHAPDKGLSIAVDSAGNAYVTGSTASRNFPTTNPLQSNRSGNAIFKSTDGAANWTASDSGLLAQIVVDVVFQPGNSSIAYAVTDAGVFKTIDGGANWTALPTTPPIINHLAIDPTNPSIMYTAASGGMFKSTDGGNNFTPINNGFSGHGRQILIDPVTPAILYGTTFGSTVFRSIDAGATWTFVFIEDANIINDLVVDPNTPSTLYAGTNRGVFKSINSGASWTKSDFGVPFDANTDGVTIDKSNGAVYAATIAGVFKSVNGGTSWTNISESLNIVTSSVAIDPTNSSVLYVATSIGVQKTIDGGATWTSANTGFPNFQINALVINPTQPATLFIASGSGPDAFVTKISAGGTSQIYSTFLGGNMFDEGYGIALDASGNAFITGTSASTNFPTANALQTAKGGTDDMDAFITKLNATGSALVYSTYLGGELNDLGQSVALDASGNAYVGGTTSSLFFPVVNAVQPINGGFFNDAFIAKINAAGSALVYSTYLGGEFNEECFGIAVDAAGHAYVTGRTSSTDFPTFAALQPVIGGSFSDVFITKLAPNGSSFIFSTFLGGTNSDIGLDIALDSSQNIYVVGSTNSNNFPTLNPLQPARGGSTDVFVAKLSPAPDVQVTVTDSPDPVNFGSNLTYTINVKNNGEVPATGVTLTDTPPAGAGLVSANSTAGTCSGTTSINCNIGTLNAGATATVTIVVTPPALSFINNTAVATINEIDAIPANNTVTTETIVIFADVAIAKKTAQNLVAPGGTLTFSLTVKNKGGVPIDVNVVDQVPEGMTLIKCAATGDGVCGGFQNIVSVNFPEIQATATETVLLTVGVSASATEGTVISNTAFATSPVPDPDTSNNSSTASVTVAAVPILPKSNGSIAFESHRQLFSPTVPSGIYTLKPDLTDEKLFPGIPTNSGVNNPEWSPDGSRLAFAVTNFAVNPFITEISVINADGSGLFKLVDNVSEFNRGITWSPNGSQIAYIGRGGPGVDTIRTIHIANTDGSGSYRLPNSPSFLSGVDWSPDGTKFVYSTGQEIFVINVDGTGQKQLTTIQNGANFDSSPRWSPDGSKIIFTRDKKFTEIYLMNADGSNFRKILNTPAAQPYWSPDGLSIVMIESNEVCTVNLDNTNHKCHFNNIFFEFAPSWQKLPNPNPTPTPTPAPTFSLSGKMTTNTPLVNIRMELDGPVSAVTESDANGDYEFVNLPAGEYTITPFSILHDFNPPSRTVTITNANITGLDFVGTFVPASISGHVKDNNGNPLAGIKITLGAQGAIGADLLTDANGFYSFTDLERHVTYFVIPDPFTPYDFVPSEKVITSLTRSEVVDFVGTKPPAHLLAGRVVDVISGQGLSGVRVNLVQDNVNAPPSFTDANGNFSFGNRKENHFYSLSITDGPLLVFEPKQDPSFQFARIQIPNLTSDQNVTFTASKRNTVQFSVNTPSVNESSASLEIVVTRSGDTADPATVNYSTADTAGLAACNVLNGKASERCDYGSTAGTLRFAAGETSKSFVIPIVNDVNVEGHETFTIALARPFGAQLTSPRSVTVTLTDNDTTPATQNPIDGIEPFVTQQYIDFLGRLPDTVGFANWVATLTFCPNGGFGENDNPSCDRVHVSAGFFLSDEFRGRGYWAYRFYEVGFDRRPLYAEFVPDLAQVGGPQSPASELLSKAAYTDAFVQRSGFTSRYNGLTNSAYVNALEQNAEITLSNKAELIAALDGNQKTRGQVLREIVESKAVEDQFFIRAFVAMQYFGYLRRDPDTIGYNNWVTTLTADPSNFRHMIFGFLFSTEYRGRFGP